MPHKLFPAAPSIRSLNSLRVDPILYHALVDGWRHLGEDKGMVNTESLTIKGKNVNIGSVFYNEKTKQIRCLLDYNSEKMYLDDEKIEAIEIKELKNANTFLSMASDVTLRFVNLGMGHMGLMATLRDKGCFTQLKGQFGELGQVYKNEEYPVHEAERTMGP